MIRYYVNLANEAVHSDKIYWVYPETGAFADFDKRYVLSLWPVFYAWLSKLTGVLPTIMAHTILPWIIIPLAYMVYEKIGELLFQDDRKMQGMFLTFAVLMHLFMSGIHTSGLTFLSITPWVGKGVLATVLIPMLFYGMLRTGKDGSAGNWILLGITGLAGCLALHGHYAGTGLCRNGGGVKRCCKEELENSPVWNVGLCALHHTGMLLYLSDSLTKRKELSYAGIS